MSAAAARLIEELEANASQAGSKPLERRLAELAVWHYSHVKHIPRDNLAARQAFLEKSFWVQVEVIALLLERLHAVEGTKSLWLPGRMEMTGDVRRFG